MPADLEAIVATARMYVGIEFSRHYLHDRQSSEDRPWASDVLYALTRGKPRIVQDDAEQDDARGAVCTVECRSPDGTLLHVRVDYEGQPMRIVTVVQTREE